ncbi:hypothetical protein ACQ4PT_049685 [Festuca glaucescens]
MMTRSKARRRRPRSPKPPPTPKKSTSTTSAAASMPTATTAQARAGARNPPETTPAAPSDQSKKRPSTVSKKAKMAWVDEWIKGDSEQKMNDDVAEEDEENMKDDDVVAGEEEEEEEAVSSAPSSPLCEPYIPNEIRGLGYDDRTHMAYKQALMPARSKYNEKRARQRKLPTLDLDTPGCGMRLGFGGGDRKHIPADGPEARKAVLDAARFVLGVSASVGGKRLGRGSCFWIDWDENDKTGIVLTTAGLILTESTLSFFGVAGYPDDVEEYADDAEVIVHLRDKTTAKAHLLYYRKHYNLALFRVKVDQPVQLPSFNDKVQCAQQIFELGRDKHMNLTIRHGRVEYSNPDLIEQYHCLSIIAGQVDFKYGNGGPVIDFDGNIVGMVDTQGTFVPSAILLKCFHLWRNYRCIPRPHLGLELCAIRLLDISHIDKILGKCKIDKGLIVKEVSGGSYAEKLGIRVGDVIECSNGEDIQTIFELENMLLSICKDHFGRGNDLNSKVDVVIRVFHTRKGLRSIKTLSANLSECKEFAQRGLHSLSTYFCLTISPLSRILINI